MNIFAPMKTKSILVLGGSGFIGQHLIEKQLALGNKVVSVDLKNPIIAHKLNCHYILADLRQDQFIELLQDTPFDEIYQLAADMGGAGYVFSGEHDADILLNSTQINLNVLRATQQWNFKGTLFFASSACIYPQETQVDELHPNCAEDMAYPANPDSDYGWEKLFAERMFAAFHRNKNLSVRIARFHNIYGPLGIFEGGKEKAPAAICRKVAQAKDGSSIEIWGDGKQTRSFLYIDDAIEALLKLMESTHCEPVNIGSEEMVSINDLAELTIQLSGKNLSIHHVNGPVGVRGRNSSNELIEKILDWRVRTPLHEGIKKTYSWIQKSLENHAN
ncbi:MAG: hypothetical protein RJB36_500 [Bacteroidota bacterium]